MKPVVLVIACLMLADLSASWYWPFGSDEEEKPRVSELMEPASLLIDEASDLSSDGKISEAVEKYREALEALDKVEADDPERAQTPEFATLRTKRAYVSAAIDSLLLAQARDNARPVAVSDTTELERKLAEERGEKVALAPKKEEPVPKKAESSAKPEAATEKAEQPAAEKAAEKASEKKAEKTVEKKRAEKPVATSRRAKPKRKPDASLTPKERAMSAIGAGDYAEADRIIAGMLEEKPNDASALNLRAIKETAEGRFRDAERTLDRAIQSNPRSHYAYYNMALLMLQADPPNVDGARRYYETGRMMGGPVDDGIEEALSK